MQARHQFLGRRSIELDLMVDQVAVAALKAAFLIDSSATSNWRAISAMLKPHSDFKVNAS